MTSFERALREAGGPAAPPAATAQLRALLAEALAHGRDELAKTRSGYDRPVLVGFVEGTAVLPVGAGLRADLGKAPPRAWTLTAATVGALTEAAGLPAPGELELRAGELGGQLVLALRDADAELAALAFEDAVARIDRLKARPVLLPPAVLADVADLRPPINTALRIAEAVGRLGGDPADPGSADALEDALDAVLGAAAGHARPHADPDPARRVARRILQRLAGMGKWGGYHTEFAHLPRGFAGNDRALAVEVGEALLAAGLLESKPSVGQRHVFLNPRRAGEIHRLVDEGELPPGLRLPRA